MMDLSSEEKHRRLIAGHLFKKMWSKSYSGVQLPKYNLSQLYEMTFEELFGLHDKWEIELRGLGNGVGDPLPSEGAKDL